MLWSARMREFPPPFHTAGPATDELRARGFVVLPPEWAVRTAGLGTGALVELAASWNGMPLDPYLKDGGHYRSRRHSSFVVDGSTCTLVAHRPHFQSSKYNALHGGMERWFEPMKRDIVELPAFQRLVVALGDLCSSAAGAERWFVEAHQFRIDTREGIGRPTPEGAHRDGVDYVAVFLIERRSVRGGETRVFEADAASGLRFTMTQPWSLLFLDDARVIHETTPIQPLDPAAHGDAVRGHRDTLVLTFRRGGFQES
jgi:hypothetical protein